MSAAAVEFEQPRVPAQRAPGVPECPYRGLLPFDAKSAHLFFGRDHQRNECLRRLEINRLLAIVGMSGAGKSSLVFAGIVPALQTGLVRGLVPGADDEWRVARLRPGSQPLGALTEAIRGLDDSKRVTTQDVETALLRSSRGLLDAVSECAGRDQNVLLIVDQFEELFRLGRDLQTDEAWRAERSAFSQLILEAPAQQEVPLYVVLTMRTDFLKHCEQFQGLPEALNEGQYFVPRLTRAQLEEAITSPAEVVGLRLNHALVKRVLSDALNSQAELPLVQHALMRTWGQWEERTRKLRAAGENPEMTLEDYVRAGEVKSALDSHANDVFEALKDDAPKKAVALLFQRITLQDRQGETRSPAPLESIQKLVEAEGTPEPVKNLELAIERFRDPACGMLMPPAGEALGPKVEIDVSHEAILRVWVRLQGWMKEERRHADAYRETAEDERSEREGNGQLLTGKRLARTMEWWAERNPKVDWARRYHTLDAEMEAIQEAARTELKAAGPSETAAQRAARELKYAAEIEAWHVRHFQRVAAYLSRSRWAVIRSRFAWIAMAGALAIVGLLAVYLMNASKRQAASSRHANSIEALKRSTTDADAKASWDAIIAEWPDVSDENREKAKAARRDYWGHRIQDALRKADEVAAAGNLEESLALYFYAVSRGLQVEKLPQNALALMRLFDDVSGTVWLPGAKPKANSGGRAEDPSCSSLAPLNQNALFGLCAGRMYSWRLGAPIPTLDTQNVGALPADAKNATRLSAVLAGDEEFLLGAAEKAAFVRDGGGKFVALPVARCPRITAFGAAAAQHGIRAAYVCEYKRAVSLLVESDGTTVRQSEQSVSDSYINDLAVVAGKLVLATPNGLFVDGQPLAKTSGLDVQHLRAISPSDTGIFVYDTASNARVPATIGVGRVGGSPADEPKHPLPSGAAGATVQKLAAGSSSTEIAVVLEVPDADKRQRNQVLIAGVTNDTLQPLELDGGAPEKVSALAVASWNRGLFTIVSLQGRLRIFTNTGRPVWSWEAAQRATGLTVQPDTLALEPVNSEKQFKPAVSAAVLLPLR